MYEWALFFHLLGAFSFFAGLTVAAVGQTAARRCTRPSEIVLLLRAARWGRRLADRLAEEDEPSPELERLLNSRLADALNVTAAAAAIAILVLMVWKPGV